MLFTLSKDYYSRSIPALAAPRLASFACENIYKRSLFIRLKCHDSTAASWKSVTVSLMLHLSMDAGSRNLIGKNVQLNFNAFVRKWIFMGVAAMELPLRCDLLPREEKSKRRKASRVSYYIWQLYSGWQQLGDCRRSRRKNKWIKKLTCRKIFQLAMLIFQMSWLSLIIIISRY